jgi:hypothetical protein
MRVTPSAISRTLFATFAFFCCACTTGAFGSPSHSSSAFGTQKVPAAAREPIADTSAPDFTIQIAPSPLTIVYPFDGTEEDGGEANGNATVTSTNGFAGQVNLTCSVAPPSFDEPVCFPFQNPVSVDASGSPSVAALLITSSTPNCVTSVVSPGVMKFPGNSGWRGRMEMEIAVALVICIGVIFPAGRRAKILRAGFICIAALMMAGCGTSTLPTDPCGDGNFDTGTPPGTYMVTITATSGSITHTTTVPLIVPPAN